MNSPAQKQNNNFTNGLIGNSWKIDKIIGLDNGSPLRFKLEKIDTNARWKWGNSVKFSPSGNFSCTYSARCGNDCFPSSNGLFQFIDSSSIKLITKQMSQTGDCDHFDTTVTKIIGVYSIIQKDNSHLELILNQDLELNALLGTWKYNKEEPLNSTTEKYKMDVEIIIYNVDSVVLKSTETEIIGQIADQAGNNAGPETDLITEYGFGKILKSSKGELIISFNINRSSFTNEHQRISREYLINQTGYNSFTIESIKTEPKQKFLKSSQSLKRG